MTIATCYVSPEGVVFGADSTTTVMIPGNQHYFNHAQKLFEIGENSTLGAVTWGLGGLDINSHRMLLASLGDNLRVTPPTSVLDAANRWAALFWSNYTTCPAISLLVAEAQALGAKTAYDPAAPPSSGGRSAPEEMRLLELRQMLVVGFCIGGYVLPDRHPMAYEVVFDPSFSAAPVPLELPMHNPRFWGAPNMIWRLLRGCDDGLRQNILHSGMWSGTEHDLNTLINQYTLGHAILPIRDAIDFTHACIASTIKALKFSNLSQICGGPIEIAVITADRPFRWVRHKAWDAAIADGGT